MDIDRRRCIAAFGALSFCAPGLARAQDAGALVGLWSGSVVYEGLMSRFRLLFTADGKETLTLVDSGNLAVEATNVVLKAPAMRLGWPEFELRIEGQLTPLDMIDAQLDQGGRAVPLRFSRGDLFPRKVATLPPPGPMTPDLLDRLRAYADTPAEHAETPPSAEIFPKFAGSSRFSASSLASAAFGAFLKMVIQPPTLPPSRLSPLMAAGAGSSRVFG